MGETVFLHHCIIHSSIVLLTMESSVYHGQPSMVLRTVGAHGKFDAVEPVRSVEAQPSASAVRRRPSTSVASTNNAHPIGGLSFGVGLGSGGSSGMGRKKHPSGIERPWVSTEMP